MLVLIDESGDTGFKFNKGSTTHFVLAAVIFDDNLEAEKLAVDLKILRRDLKLSDDFEFHFNGCSPKIRKAFLEQARKGKYRVRSLVIDKRLITGHELRTSPSSFYNYAVKLLLKDNKGGINNASIKIDGHGERRYKQAASSYLKRQLNTRKDRIIDKLKIVDSRKDILIQLADMVCGAIARAHGKKTRDAHTYQELIKARIENVWIFR